MRGSSFTLLVAILPMTGVLTACRGGHNLGKCTSPAKANIAFRSAIKNQHPEWRDELKLRVALVDKGNYWDAWFQLPASEVGGTAIGKVDKASCHVFDISHEQ